MSEEVKTLTGQGKVIRSICRRILELNDQAPDQAAIAALKKLAAQLMGELPTRRGNPALGEARKTGVQKTLASRTAKRLEVKRALDELRAQGLYTNVQLAEALNTQTEIKPFRAEKWSPELVRAIDTYVEKDSEG